MKITRLFLLIASVLILGVWAAQAQDLPKPRLRFVGVVEQVNNGVAVRAYEVEVVNRDEFDNELFVPSPGLPPCGVNANASRTWINIYNESRTRLYGFCAIASNTELGSLRFLIEASKPQPKKLTLEFLDRFEARIVRSNAVKVE